MEYVSAVIILLVVLCLLRLVLFKGTIGKTVEQPPVDIIDMHCHTAGFGAGGSGAWVSGNLGKSWKFGLYLKIFGSNKAEVEKEGDAILMKIISDSIRQSKHVNGAVILAMDAPHTPAGELDREAAEVVVPNRFVGESVKGFQNLHFGASVHPSRKDALEELEWSKANGAVLVKWLPNIQNIDPSDERYRNYYEKLVELDLPLLTHVGDEDSFTQTNNALGDPQLLRLPLECGVRVMAAHVASSGQSEGQDNVERLLEMMPDFPNLFADISTLTQMNRKKHLPVVLNDPRLTGRLMYGTDYPLTNTPLVTSLQFFMNLSLRQIWDLLRTRNSWDRDVNLKAQLGTRREVFELSRTFLKIPR